MKNSRKRIFITGIAGFIGFHLAKALIARGDQVFGCDNFNDYYSPALKKERARLLTQAGIPITTCDICDPILATLIEKQEPTHLVHLAAQAGVRMSLKAPEKYQEANGNGFFRILEILRQNPSIKCTFASSSSVYGLNKKIPFSENDTTDHPANFYGATKKCNEAMAFAYHNLYGISMTALRYFTVYGPFGRPDMAYYDFTKAIEEEQTIKLFNSGNMQRDFTYIDDIVTGTIAAMDLEADYEIFNLGNNHPEELHTLISLIESHLGKKARIENLPMPPGEIQITYADITKAKEKLNWEPTTTLQEGMAKFLFWYDKQGALSLKR
ncbi:MAG: UDP-N-acetylglucosamine 4-epimerase [Chlamydiae bacterium]|nr:UDP-N-acetylglucosamine 4-epimerase [Chlamydiota bacterium]